MRFFVQRVESASIYIDNNLFSSINNGLLVYVGFTLNDNNLIVDKMLNKLLSLRIFEDNEGKTNNNIITTNSNILMVSQFTLYSNFKGYNRPSFSSCMPYKDANVLYNYLVEKIKLLYDKVSFGKFGANMKVNSINDGPFSVLLDSDNI